MPIKRLQLEHTALMGSAVSPHAARLMQLGRFRGGPTPTGGFFVEIVGNGETRRAEMTPREAVAVAKQMLEHYGIHVTVDLGQFQHTHG